MVESNNTRTEAEQEAFNQRMLLECLQFRGRAAEREEEQKEQRNNSAKLKAKAARLNRGVEAACAEFDRIKAMQSGNVDASAVMAMGDVRRMGQQNLKMLAAAKLGIEVKSLNNKRVSAAVQQ